MWDSTVSKKQMGRDDGKEIRRRQEENEPYQNLFDFDN